MNKKEHVMTDEEYERTVKIVRERIEWFKAKKGKGEKPGLIKGTLLTVKTKRAPRGESIRLLGRRGPRSNYILRVDQSEDGKGFNVVADFDPDACLKCFERILDDLLKEKALN